MNTDSLLKQRLICVAIIDKVDHAVPLAEALLAGGLNVLEITFRTDCAAECIARIRKSVPQIAVGAGTLLTVENVQHAVDAGAQFGVSPGLSEFVLNAARERHVPIFPGVVTPSDVTRALELGCKQLKFFPAEAAGGVAMLKALAAPFSHTGVKFIPTGGINAASLADYLAVPHVAAVGGSWMVERQLVSNKAWGEITALTAEALKIVAQSKTK